VHTALKAYHARHFCAQALRVVLYAGEPLPKLGALLRRHCGGLPRGDAAPPDYSSVGFPFDGVQRDVLCHCSCTSGLLAPASTGMLARLLVLWYPQTCKRHMRRSGTRSGVLTSRQQDVLRAEARVCVLPTATPMRGVTLTWQWPSQRAHFPCQADHYLRQLIEDEGAGGLAAALRARGWLAGGVQVLFERFTPFWIVQVRRSTVATNVMRTCTFSLIVTRRAVPFSCGGELRSFCIGRSLGQRMLDEPAAQAAGCAICQMQIVLMATEFEARQVHGLTQLAGMHQVHQQADLRHSSDC
jgi:hypothetical protein